MLPLYIRRQRKFDIILFFSDPISQIDTMVRQIIDSPNESSLSYENFDRSSQTEESDWLLQLCCGVQTDSVDNVLSHMKETAECLGMNAT